jgi:hypothetical protein
LSHQVFNWTHRNQAQHIAEQDRKAREARCAAQLLGVIAEMEMEV